MSGRLPHDAFDRYFALGDQRSYQALADQLGCSKQSVTKLATREKWQQQIEEIEAKARANNTARAVQTLEEVNELRLKIWKMVEKRSLEAIRNHPFETGTDGVRALDIAHRNMRLIVGEPTERTESIEHVVRREYERWMQPRPKDGDHDDRKDEGDDHDDSERGEEVHDDEDDPDCDDDEPANGPGQAGAVP